MDTDAHPAKRIFGTTAGSRTVSRTPNARARLILATGLTYERFLELPVAVVLAVLWATGVAILGSGALALCLAVGVLARSVAGDM